MWFTSSQKEGSWQKYKANIIIRVHKVTLKTLEDKTTENGRWNHSCNQEAVSLQEDDEWDLTIKLNEDGAETDLQLQDEIY